VFACGYRECGQGRRAKARQACLYGEPWFSSSLCLAETIAQVIGGLHLAGPELVPRIPHTVDFLANELRPSPMYVLPMHCSGFQSKIALERAFGDGCVPGGVGMKVEIRGDREGDAKLLPAVFA